MNASRFLKVIDALLFAAVDDLLRRLSRNQLAPAAPLLPFPACAHGRRLPGHRFTVSLMTSSSVRHNRMRFPYCRRPGCPIHHEGRVRS